VGKRGGLGQPELQIMEILFKIFAALGSGMNRNMRRFVQNQNLAVTVKQTVFNLGSG
jgi:hypothetical protein